MVSMTIRHVSEADGDRLAEKAAGAGRSLQEHLLALVRDDAAREDPWESSLRIALRCERVVGAHD